MGCCNCLRTRHFWCSYLIGLLLLVILVCVHGQNPNSDGYINIDCGISSNTSYVDSFTGLTYVSDDQYIDTDTGFNRNVSTLYTIPDAPINLETLRSFPSNIKNCYTLKPVSKGLKYLVRATFFYGNYDKTGKTPLSFDLYFGVNFWSTVNITASIEVYIYEIIAIAPANYIHVCLVNTGHGIPFISVLELRPINSTLYEADSKQSLNFVIRNDTGSNNKYELRYPQDVHDRLWFSWTDPSWTAISTNNSMDGKDVPSLVLQTAAVSSSVNASIDITWQASDESTFYYALLHFAEIQVVPKNGLREFNLYGNGMQVLKDPIALIYNMTGYAFITWVGNTDYNISLKSTERATLPPILNAFELYTIVPITWLPTDDGDVTAINAIKTNYGIRKGWSGDPCVPPSLNWTGVNCTISDLFNIPMITALNLSSSGLNGTIISDFGSLIALEILDLSHNNLSGNIPGSLDKLLSLSYLVLSGNVGLSRTLPSGLQKKVNEGHLTVIFDGTSIGTGHKNFSKAVIIVAVLAIFLILGVVALFLFHRKKNKKTRIKPPTDHEGPHISGMASNPDVLDNPPTDHPIKDFTISEDGRKELNIEKRKFSFEELKVVTNNFRDQIGIGGFGKVFKGRLEDGKEVAVKVRSELSSQGIQQFLNEVEKLSRAHHKNLVSLIGYCKDGDHIALVYEFMQNGNLQEWLTGSTRFLQWKQRLCIAYESAQGLEYLHKMCNPPLIHRDVKTNNILLTGNMEAKVSDFGLVRDCCGTHVSTQVVGTPGYVDPYYASISKLTEKSDIYSFGVVLLEIVTGNSAIHQGPQREHDHLIQFVLQRISKGSIESILDPNMGSQYNIKSIWKVADLALRCTDQPAKRPDMTEIVTELKETLNLEVSSNEMSSVASEDISQCNNGGEVQDDNFKMAHIGGMQQPDSGPSAR